MNDFDIINYQADVQQFVTLNLSNDIHFESKQIDFGNSVQPLIYKFGNPNNEKIVICPPCGISFLALFDLIKMLSKQFYIITWESLGLPDMSLTINKEYMTLEKQSQQAYKIIISEKLTDFNLICWCQAAQVFLNLKAKFPNIIFKTMTLISPSGIGLSTIESTFNEQIAPIYIGLIHNSRQNISLLRKMLFDYENENLTFAEYIRNIHLTNTEATIRYGLYLEEYILNKPCMKKLIQKAAHQIENNVRIQLIHAKNDNFSHYSESVALSKLWSSSKLLLIPNGGHEIIFNKYVELAQYIDDFIHEKI